MTSPHISNSDRAARANHALNAYIEVADCLDEPEIICDS